MNNFIYAADTYCEDCGRAIRERLTREGNAPADPSNERSYDSGDFPKGPYDASESDTPQHCAACHVHLENDLTPDGVQYVLDYLTDALRTGSATDIEQLWAADLADYCLDSNQAAILDQFNQRFGVAAE